MGLLDWFLRKKGSDYVLAPIAPTDIAKRLSALGLAASSADAKSRLDATGIEAGPSHDGGPLTEIDWIVDVDLAPGAVLGSGALQAARKKSGVAALPCTALFARSGGADWQVVDDETSDDAAFDALALGCRLLLVKANGFWAPSATELEEVLAAAEKLSAQLGARGARSRTPVAAGVERVHALRDAWPPGTARVVIVVQAPDGKPFHGRKLWGALTSLGLRWGDGDLFRWSPPGTPDLFTVSTTTPPGFFIPEDLVTGKHRPCDLVFEFQVAHSPAPARVLDAMIAAAGSTKQLLGGSLRGHDGSPFDAEEDRATMKKILAALGKVGIAPGSPAALSLW